MLMGQVPITSREVRALSRAEQRSRILVPRGTGVPVSPIYSNTWYSQLFKIRQDHVEVEIALFCRTFEFWNIPISEKLNR